MNLLLHKAKALTVGSFVVFFHVRCCWISPAAGALGGTVGAAPARGHPPTQPLPSALVIEGGDFVPS